MAKVSIKSEKITPFGGIFHVRELFSRYMAPDGQGWTRKPCCGGIFNGQTSEVENLPVTQLVADFRLYKNTKQPRKVILHHLRGILLELGYLQSHATGRSQCRHNRRCDTCYHLHDELKSLFLFHGG